MPTVLGVFDYILATNFGVSAQTTSSLDLAKGLIARKRIGTKGEEKS